MEKVKSNLELEEIEEIEYCKEIAKEEKKKEYADPTVVKNNFGFEKEINF